MSENLSKFKLFLMLIPLIAAPVALYMDVAGFGFTWDDKPLYINEQTFPYDNPFRNILREYVPEENEVYVPFTKTVWSVVASQSIQKNADDTFYYSPEYFHILNLVFHILNSILAFVIFRKILENDWASLFGALVFALHPVCNEPVAWISEFRGILSTFWGLLALIMFLSYRAEAGKPKYIFTFIFLGLSVLSKPSGVVFPFILILTDLIANKPKIKVILKTSLPLVLVVLPILYTAVLSEAQSSEIFDYPFWLRGLFFLDSFQFYLFKAIAPLNLAASYGRTPEFIQQSPFFYYSGASLLVIIGLLVWKRKTAGKYLIALSIFILGFLPVSGLVPFYYQYWSLVADRYAYIAIIGFALGISALLAAADRPKLTVPLAILLLGGYFYLGTVQLPTWQNDKTMWGNVIEKYPERSASPYSSRGIYYLGSGEPQKALADFNRALELDSAFPEIYLNRGNAFYDLNIYDSAVSDYSRSIIKDKINPSKAYINRAKSHSALGRLDNALKDYTTALKYEPEEVYAVYSDRGIVFARLGLLDEAIADFKNALRINPHSKMAYENLQYAQMLKQKVSMPQADTAKSVK